MISESIIKLQWVYKLRLIGWRSLPIRNRGWSINLETFFNKLDTAVSGTDKSSFFPTFGNDCSYFFSVTRCFDFDSLCFQIDLKWTVCKAWVPDKTLRPEVGFCANYSQHNSGFTHVEFFAFLELFSEDSSNGTTTATTGHSSIISMDRHLSK